MIYSLKTIDYNGTRDILDMGDSTYY